MRGYLLLLLPALILVVTACSATTQTSNQTAPQPIDSAQDNPAPRSTESVSSANDSTSLTRIDQQGAVVVEVTPLNLNNPINQIEFDVALNTHSIDLSMDLATLATLTTDTGITVQATLWDAVPGGHHVSGKLIFTALKDGKSILDGASKLTLEIINVDVPSRVFEWQLK